MRRTKLAMCVMSKLEITNKSISVDAGIGVSGVSPIRILSMKIKKTSPKYFRHSSMSNLLIS